MQDNEHLADQPLDRREDPLRAKKPWRAPQVIVTVARDVTQKYNSTFDTVYHTLAVGDS